MPTNGRYDLTGRLKGKLLQVSALTGPPLAVLLYITITRPHCHLHYTKLSWDYQCM